MEDYEGGQGEVFWHSALKSVVIPSTLEVIEQCTFCRCKKLTSVVFAEGSRIREIGPNCFAESGLKMFKAPPSLRKICDRAFYFCKKLRRVVLNEGLEIVGVNDYAYCMTSPFENSGIKEIVLHSTLVKLNKGSFRYCYSLKRVWVEQHCRVRITDYVESDVDVRVFRAGDEIPLNENLDSTESTSEFS